MSTTQPTVRDHFLKKREIIQGYLDLLKRHEPKWGEAEHYSAQKTRKVLNNQIEDLDEILSWCEEE